MKYVLELTSIKGVQSGALLYNVDGKTEKINLKESAAVWWDIYNKSSMLNTIFKRKARNKYIGEKCFNLKQVYIKMYAGQDEYIFIKSIPQEFDLSDACELRTWWDNINMSIIQAGYYLFDVG